MPLTSVLSTVTVGGQYVDLTGSPIAGQVKFTPRSIIVDAFYNQIIVNRTVTVDLDATGSFTVVLPATDDPDTSPVSFTYKVEEAFTGGRTYDISLPAAAPTINLADVAPAVPATGTEASTYVLLATFTALETRVTAVETTTTAVNTAAVAAGTANTTLQTATTAAQTAATAAQSTASSASSAAASVALAQASVIHPFIFVGV